MPTRDFRWTETAQDFDLFGDGSIRIIFCPGHSPGHWPCSSCSPTRTSSSPATPATSATEWIMASPLACTTRAQGSGHCNGSILMRDTWDARIWIGHDIDDWNSWPHAPEFVD